MMASSFVSVKLARDVTTQETVDATAHTLNRALVTLDGQAVATEDNTIEVALAAIPFLEDTDDFSAETVRTVKLKSKNGWMTHYREVAALDVKQKPV